MDFASLWSRHQAGESNARAELIESYSALALRIARGLHVPTGALAGRDDLESAAVVGLIQAVDRFQPDRGVPFEAFAALRIRGAVLDELRLVDDQSRGERQRSRLNAEEPAPPHTLSLDRLLDAGLALLSDEAALDDVFEIEDLRGRVKRALDELPQRQRELVTNYYEHSLTLRESAQRMSISEPRASQLHTRAIANLRRALRPTPTVPAAA